MKPMRNVRDLLTGIGIGQFNATMIIPYMFIAPATTDPKSGQIILLVQHIQKVLYDMGATYVPNSGILDPPTARALRTISGPNWERMSWSANVANVLDAKEGGATFDLGDADGTPLGHALGGPLDFLPDVPGGLLTYGVAAYLLYRHFSKRRSA